MRIGAHDVWYIKGITEFRLPIVLPDATWLGEAMEGWPARGLVAQVFVEASDALFERAVNAGASAVMPMTDMFFGSREGRVSDPAGNLWALATLQEYLSPQEMRRRMNSRS
jgi:PhnB protein